MSVKVKNYKRAINITGMAGRVCNREDNIYKLSVITDILKMYFDECLNALEDGEKVGLSTIGTITPHVHTPKTYGCLRMNSPEGNKPYTTIQFTRGITCRERLDRKFWKNLKKGFAGLGERCQCNKAQKNVLIEKGFLAPEYAEEVEECTEE